MSFIHLVYVWVCERCEAWKNPSVMRVREKSRSRVEIQLVCSSSGRVFVIDPSTNVNGWPISAHTDAMRDAQADLYPANSAKPVPSAVVSLDSRQGQWASC